MKKLFTLAAALLASVAMMAQTTMFEWGDMSQTSMPDPTVGTLENVDLDGYASVKINTNSTTVYGLKCASSMANSGVIVKYYKIKPAEGESFAVGDTLIYTHVYNNSSEKTTTISVATCEDNTIVYNGAQTVNGRNADGYTEEKFVLTVAADSLALGRVGSTGTFILSIKVVRPAPATTPVTSVSVEASATETYVNKSVTFSASADVTANEYSWKVNGELVEGADAASFVFKPETAGTYQIVAQARNEFNNGAWIASDAVELVATERVIVDQVSISEATTWDWTKAASVSEIKWTADSEPYKKNVDTVVMANIEGMNNNDDFNSQALLFNGEYPVRNSEYAQGNMISFTTTVSGYVKVDFSNTGTKDVARYVAVNGVVDTTVGTLNQDRVSSAYIPVAAGEVKIEGRFENYDDGPQYLHFFQIVFGTGDVPTAISNTNAAVKAVKVVRNGQLFIEKNGVLYNAQGAIVK